MNVKTHKIPKHLGVIDLFVFSSGFEKRATKLGEALDLDLVKKSYAFHLDETYNISDEHIQTVSKNLTNTERLTYPKNQPLETFDIFNQILKDFVDTNYKRKKIVIVIDVTAFTREIMLILIRVLSTDYFKQKTKITLIHTPAESYSEEHENLWLTKGVREIRSVGGYSGLHSPSKKLLLILLNGFEEERANTIIESFEPFKLIVGKPSENDSITSGLNKISNEKFQTLVTKHNNILLQKFEFSCQDIQITKNAMSELCQKYCNEYNIVDAPLNNKVSTIAVGLFVLENEEVQICYASANQYNIDSPHEACDYFICHKLYDYLENFS